MRVRVYPYKQGSRSALALAQGLNGRVLKLEGSSYVPKEGDAVINWGSSQCPYTSCLNKPALLEVASNKLSAFRAMREADVSIPDFASSPGTVSWKGLTVVRHKLTGHSGEGIELIDPGGSLPGAPLYVQYIKKKDEYRVHIIGSLIVAVQRKARNPEVEVPDWKVRNHANGFIFVRNGFTAPADVLHVSQRAITALGLDFGAVDVIWNEEKRKAFVLEVNTAPGLEGQTIEDYVNGFKTLFSTNVVV